MRQWTGGERQRLLEHFHSVGRVRALRQRDEWGHRKAVIASRLRAVRAQAVFNPPALGERWREWRGGWPPGAPLRPPVVFAPLHVLRGRDAAARRGHLRAP